jgi:lipopolysaccharide biosynthesis regulator YciM
VGQVRVQVDESAVAVVPAGEATVEDVAFVGFAVAGSQVAGEFRCADCGYGAVVLRVLPACPMCGGTVWESQGPLARRYTD